MSGTVFHPFFSYRFVDHFGLATILSLSMSSLRTSNSRTKVMIDTIRVKIKLLIFFFSFQRDPERCRHSERDRHPSRGLAVIFIGHLLV